MPSKRAEAAGSVASTPKRTPELAVDPHESEAEVGATVKRRKGLGVRVIGGRIYDSDNGKTCHQCRQKTIDVMASCKDSSRSRPCTQHYCTKCLLNRYGEKVTEVAQTSSWSCPKCRGICNCSICLKKQGCVPTGILAHTAKATGFTSVAELLTKCPAVRVDCEEGSLSPSNSEIKRNETDMTAFIPTLQKSPNLKAKKRKASAVADGEALLSPLNDEMNKDDSGMITLPSTGQKSPNLKAKKARLIVTRDGNVEGPVANALLRTPPTNRRKASGHVSSDVSSTKTKKVATELKKSTAFGKKAKKTVATKTTLSQVVLSQKSTSTGASEVSLNVEGPVSKALGRLPPNNLKKASQHASSDVSPSKTQKVDTELNINKSISSAKEGKKAIAAKATLSQWVLPLKPTSSGASEVSLNKVKREDGEVLPVKLKKRNSEDKNTADMRENKQSISKGAKLGRKKAKLDGKINADGEAGASKAEDKSFLKKEAKKKERVDNSSCKLKPKNCKDQAKEPKKKCQAGKTKFSEAEKEIILPQGEPLLTVGGMDFPAEAIGPAVQFIEFCLAFQSVLGLRRGDAEAVLRELSKGRLARKGCNSMLIQLQAKLLNIIESSISDLGGEVTQASSGKRSWLNILKKHLNERSHLFMGLSTDTEKMSLKHVHPVASTVVLEEDLKTIKDAIEGGAESYENLSMYHKLQLLIILSDDSLETQKMRDYIESVNREYNEALKGRREEVLAARKEVRDARQKIKDAEVAKLIALGNINGPLSLKDQEALLAKVQVETQRAVAAASLEKEAMSRIKKNRSDAVRTDAIAWGLDGRVFYKLKAIENMNRVVVQERKAGQSSLDSWRIYSDADEAALTKHLIQRAKISRAKMLAEAALENPHIEAGDAEKENRIPNSVDAKVELAF